MDAEKSLLTIVPVIPSADIERDVKWYHEKTGFEYSFGDKMYAGIQRDKISIHLQWHAGTEDDPLLGGSVVKIFVKNVKAIFEELVKRGTVADDKLRMNTPWNTHEFGFYDLNNNAIFLVQSISQ